MSKKQLLTLLSTAAISAVAALSVPVTSVVAAPSAESRATNKRITNNAYIVQLAEQPVSAYSGGIKGLQATKPRRGQKIDPNSPAVVNYRSFLESRQDEMLAKVGGGKKLHSYGYVFNGFAAELTAEQAAKLAQTKGVLAVTKDEARSLDTTSTPDFLALTAPGGAWSQTKGEGVIIGIVDGGIWPESLSFSDRTGTNGNASKEGKLAYRQIPGWNGRCIPGEEFNASLCNQKLIGARYYNAGWGGNAGIDAQLPWEFNSPRDFGGHGTHVASTAGGNQNVPTTGPASVFGTISGIAPRARIAAYKVCWETGAGGSCFTTDSVAAIDQAVADGVDVINFSISGSRTNFRDPVEIAFLFAADAGVFVAASAGNSGPTTSTVAHPGPWLTTVAAGTHNRNGVGSTTLGNGATYAGASFATSLPSTPLVDAADVAASGANSVDAELCFPGALDAAAVAGKVVLCKRGVIALVDKSLAVFEAGGTGMILYNDPAGAANTLALFHSVPSVHLVAASGLAVKAYIAGAGASATASIAAATVVYDVAAPLTASFSSRGPLLAGNGDLLKPDLIAPGQDILAAVAPPGNNGKSFDLYSGTSMSSPHVAGLAALMKQKHPSWSPMAIKSALMTTGTDVLDGGTPAPNTNPILIFRQGAGHVQPNSALNPGLVYDSGFNDWLAFICATQPTGLEGTCNALWNMGYSRDASDFNSPSIAIGDLGGVQTIKRSVKNVSGQSLTVNATTTGMGGFTVTVTPSSLTLAPGQTKSFEVTFLRTAAPLNAYTGGQLYWTGGGYTARSPIVVRPVALGAPVSVSGTGGALSYSVVFGYDGPFSATPRGLIPAATTDGVVADDPTDGACSLTAPNAQLIPVAIPAGTTYARFSLFDADVSPGADIDLCVANARGTIVGSSGSGTSAEEVNLLNPAAGTYTVVVQGWGVVGSSPFKLHTWLLGSADAGNMTVTAPATATTGGTGTIELSFSGLAVATRYLGSVAYAGATGMPSPTIVRVDTP
jgi:subtilisin family serine protease